MIKKLSISSFFLLFVFILFPPQNIYASSGSFEVTGGYVGPTYGAHIIGDNFSPESIIGCNTDASRFYNAYTNTPVGISWDSCQFSTPGATVGVYSQNLSDGNYYIILEDYSGYTWMSQVFSVINNQIIVQASPTPAQTKLATSPSTDTVTVGTPFNVDVKVEDGGEAFNAVRANVAVSSNLSVTGLHMSPSNPCNLYYLQNPTVSNPSFAGAIFGGSSTGCNVYTLTLTPISAGEGTIGFNNASIKSYLDASEILTGVQNASFTITEAPTGTPTPDITFTITNPLLTYNQTFNLTGTKTQELTNIFVNDSETGSTYPTTTTWQNTQTLSLGENNFTLYGQDNNNNQTLTQNITINRHTLGDINGDGLVDLTDASLFTVDWDKTENLTYILSDMNNDRVVDLTDLSILAKLE